LKPIPSQGWRIKAYSPKQQPRWDLSFQNLLIILLSLR